ncbi:flavodoxin [Janibacter sp. G56]|uniref:flavodoxin n=1 Tax=Janibacter sp. G56 TaxID=3418717 RepID=UPI003D01D177
MNGQIDISGSKAAMTRRAALRSAGALALTATAGCSTPAPPAPRRPPSTAVQPPDAPARSWVLLAYFSRPGENYWYGGRRNLKVGNTQVVAQMIAARLRIDPYRAEPADPYPFEYEPTVVRNQQEQQQDARPALSTALPSLDEYDVLMLGGPVWNVGAPMIMHTLLEQWATKGKTILPFVTYAVSGMGRVAEEYAALAPDATIGDGLAVRGEHARSATDEVDRWLRRVRLLPRE